MGAALAVVGLAVPASAATADGAGTGSSTVTPDVAVPYTWYSQEVFDVGPKMENNRGPIIGQCSPGNAGSCAITSLRSTTTEVGATLGATKDWLAAQLSFKISATSSTSSSCTSRKMAANETYYAFAVGTRRTYSVREYRNTEVAGHLIGHTLVATSTNQSAWQPYTYPAVSCAVYQNP